ELLAESDADVHLHVAHRGLRRSDADASGRDVEDGAERVGSAASLSERGISVRRAALHATTVVGMVGHESSAPRERMALALSAAERARLRPCSSLDAERKRRDESIPIGGGRGIRTEVRLGSLASRGTSGLELPHAIGIGVYGGGGLVPAGAR